MHIRGLICSAAIVGLALGGAARLAAQDQSGAPEIRELWLVADQADCAGGPPSLETCGTDDILKELEVAWLCVRVYDPDFVAEEEGSEEQEDELYFNVESEWWPYRKDGIIYPPEPPPVATDDDRYRLWGPYTDADPATGEMTVSLPFQVPEFNGTNQARLRGYIDFDIRWIVYVTVQDADENESFTVMLDVPICAIENLLLRPGNPPTFADAGGGQTVATGSTITLDASRTFDGWNVGFDRLSPDVLEKDNLEFTWELVSWPSNLNEIDRQAAIPVPDSQDPALATATLLVNGTYVYRVLASDGINMPPSSSEVTIIVVDADQLPESNSPPRAIIAEPSGPVVVGGIITLDGSGSSDPDGDTLSYRWKQTNELGGDLTPDEVQSAFQPLSGLTESSSTWRSIAVGTFYFRLLATDPYGRCDTALVSIEVVDVATAGRTIVCGETDSEGSESGQTNSPAAPTGCGGGLLPLAMVPVFLWLARGRLR